MGLLGFAVYDVSFLFSIAITLLAMKVSRSDSMFNYLSESENHTLSFSLLKQNCK